MNKKFLTLLILLGVNFLCLLAEPSGRGYDPDAPDIGLPEGNEVLTGLIIAIIAIPLGYFILNIGKSENGSYDNLFTGCLGVIFIVGGLVCLLPLVAWIFSILSAIYAIGFIIIAILVIISLFSKK